VRFVLCSSLCVRRRSGWSALHAACAAGYARAAEMLLDSGARVDVMGECDCVGVCAHVCVCRACDARLTARTDQKRQLPIHYAVRFASLVQLLPRLSERT
jgi:ankyrin repeat protein